MNLEEDVFHIYAKFHLWKLRLSQDMPKSKCLGNRLNTGSQHLRPKRGMELYMPNRPSIKNS